jgi:hypothetical protein
MKINSRIIILAALTASFCVEGCKKGEGDPFLSLRSRKARVAGEWTVTSGTGKKLSLGTTTTWTFDGSTYTETIPPLPPITKSLTMEFTFEKDGAMTKNVVETAVSFGIPVVQTTESVGTWNFIGGVGDIKNKSQIILTVNKVTVSVTGSATPQVTVYEGSDAPTETFDIYQLKNKEMILKSSGSTTLAGITTTTEAEWTLTSN